MMINEYKLLLQSTRVAVNCCIKTNIGWNCVKSAKQFLFYLNFPIQSVSIADNKMIKPCKAFAQTNF